MRIDFENARFKSPRYERISHKRQLFVLANYRVNMLSDKDDDACLLLDSSDGRCRKRKYNKHSLEQQLKCVTVAKQSSNREAARRFGVDERCVRRWRKNEKDIAEQQSHRVVSGGKRARLSGAGRKTLFDASAERELVDWVKAKRDKNERVTRRTVLQQAANIATDRHLSSFKGGAGWLRGFLRRHNITQRRRTTVCQKAPAELVQEIIDFVMFVRRARIKDGYGSDAVYACDETAFWPDSAASTTLDFSGIKEVPIKTTGHDKQRLTVLLTARADGRKLRPFVLLPRKRPLRQLEKFKNKLEIVYCGISWMDDALTATYLEKILGPSLFLKKRLLVWDSFRCHVSDATKKKLKQLKIDTAVVPGGCTKYVQPADVSWNRPFKAHIQVCHIKFYFLYPTM